MKIEVWNASTGLLDHPKADWHYHFITGGHVTPSTGGYDTKAIAITAVCKHAIAMYALATGQSASRLAPEAKAVIRERVRAHVKVLA